MIRETNVIWMSDDIIEAKRCTRRERGSQRPSLSGQKSVPIYCSRDSPARKINATTKRRRWVERGGGEWRWSVGRGERGRTADARRL